MNEHDSERIAGLFEQDGMIKANSIDDSDILFVNTVRYVKTQMINYTEL